MGRSMPWSLRAAHWLVKWSGSDGRHVGTLEFLLLWPLIWLVPSASLFALGRWLLDGTSVFLSSWLVGLSVGFLIAAAAHK